MTDKQAYKIKKYKCRMVSDGHITCAYQEVVEAEQAAAIFMKVLKGLPHEEVHALYLNGASRITGLECIARGGIDTAAFAPRDLYRSAILARASVIILAHNHPSGDPTPSENDILMTKELVKAGEIIGIQLVDHLVCCPETEKWDSVFTHLQTPVEALFTNNT